MKTLSLLLLFLTSTLALAQYVSVDPTGPSTPFGCSDTNVPTYSGGVLICGAGGGGGGGGVWGSITGTLSSQLDLQGALNAKQNSLGFTAEDVANKDIDGTFAANSDVKYPSQKAAKTYVDTGLATKQATLTPGTASSTTPGVTVIGTNATVGPAITVDVQTSTDAQPGLLSAADHTSLSGKFTLPSLTSGSILFSNGTTIVQDNSNLFWNNTNKELQITKPSSVAVSGPVLTLNSDPGGTHGFGQHLLLAGNPGGGAWIYRDTDAAFTEILGGSTETTGGVLWANGNTSTNGDAGGVQVTLGLVTSSFDVYDHTQTSLRFSVLDTGVVNVPGLAASSVVTTDASSNLSTSAKGNLTGSGMSVTSGTGAVLGAGTSLALTQTHDLWIARQGVDAAGCGQITNQCQTVGYALGLVTAPSSTNNWTIHVSSGRNDAETGDLLIPPYTWIVGSGGPDVGSYLRLPAGKAIKLGAGWTSNGRGGLQSLYLGGGTSVNLDFAAIGGAAGSNFIFDTVSVTGSFNHTGRGVNGGDFLVMQNSWVFGSSTLTASELQSDTTNWLGNLTIANSATVPTHASFIGSSIGGNFSFTQSSGQSDRLDIAVSAFGGTFTTTGTLALKVDGSLPVGYSISGGTTRTNYTDAASMAFSPATPGNWSPAPALVSTALDQLAAKTSAVPSESVVEKSANYTVTLSNQNLIGDAAGGAFAFTLPSAASAFVGGKSQIFTFIKKDTSANVVSISRAGADTFLGGGTSISLTTQSQVATIFTDGSIWYVR